MPILLTDKTLQAVQYDLHCVVNVRAMLPDQVLVYTDVYASLGHMDDGFLPIIRKTHTITSPSILELARMAQGNGQVSYSILLQGIESYLVANESFYEGGEVI